MTEFKSPIEEKFFEAAKKKIPGLIPQMPVTACGRSYRLDFAKIIRDEKAGKDALKVAIELDGYEYHSSMEQRNHDVERDRDLMHDGWQIIRFTGSHINRDVEKCVDEAVLLIEKWSNERGIGSGLKKGTSAHLRSQWPEDHEHSRGPGIQGPKMPKAILAVVAAIILLGAILLTSEGIIPSTLSGTSPWPGNLPEGIPSLENLSPSPAGPQAPGSKVIWTAILSKGTKGDIVYRFWLKGPATEGSWRDATGWIKENRWTWATTSYDLGQNQIKVEVRARDRPGNESSFKVQDYSLVKANMPPVIAELKSDSYSPQDTGSSVVWTANASDPDNDIILYRFLLKGPATDDGWRDMTGWTKEDSWKWKTTSSDVGDSQIQVQARDGKHAEKEDCFRVENFSISSTNRPPAIYDLIPDPKSPREVGSRVNWKANASDKDGDGIYYRFMLKGPSTDGEWRDETGWTKSSIWSWDTSSMEAGNYQVKAQVNDDDDGDEKDSTIGAYSLISKVVPEEVVPEEVVPEEVVPEEVVPGEVVPGEVVPGEVVPEEIVSEAASPVEEEKEAAEENSAENTEANVAQKSSSKSEEKVATAPLESEPEQGSQTVESTEASPAKVAAPQSSADQPEDPDQNTASSAKEDGQNEEAVSDHKAADQRPNQAGAGAGAEAEVSPRSAEPDSITRDKADAQVQHDDGTIYLGGATGERILARIAPSGTAPSGAG